MLEGRFRLQAWSSSAGPGETRRIDDRVEVVAEELSSRGLSPCFRYMGQP
jgi:hypothetical protein